MWSSGCDDALCGDQAKMMCSVEFRLRCMCYVEFRLR